MVSRVETKYEDYGHRCNPVNQIVRDVLMVCVPDLDPLQLIPNLGAGFDRQNEEPEWRGFSFEGADWLRPPFQPFGRV